MNRLPPSPFGAEVTQVLVELLNVVVAEVKLGDRVMVELGKVNVWRLPASP